MARTNQAATTNTKTSATAALLIRSRSDQGFCRCGLRFPPQGTLYALDCFTPQQIEILRTERELIVEDAEALVDVDETETTDA